MSGYFAPRTSKPPRAGAAKRRDLGRDASSTCALQTNAMTQ
jgi:hypothetical protein